MGPEPNVLPLDDPRISARLKSMHTQKAYTLRKHACLETMYTLAACTSREEAAIVCNLQHCIFSSRSAESNSFGLGFCQGLGEKVSKICVDFYLGVLLSQGSRQNLVVLGWFVLFGLVGFVQCWFVLFGLVRFVPG